MAYVLKGDKSYLADSYGTQATITYTESIEFAKIFQSRSEAAQFLKDAAKFNRYRNEWVPYSVNLSLGEASQPFSLAELGMVPQGGTDYNRMHDMFDAAGEDFRVSVDINGRISLYIEDSDTEFMFSSAGTYITVR